MDTREYTLLGILDQLLLQADRPSDTKQLALRLDLSVTDVARGMGELEAKGLVDATRFRLTMSGLAAASALAGARRRARTQRAA